VKFRFLHLQTIAARIDHATLTGLTHNPLFVFCLQQSKSESNPSIAWNLKVFFSLSGSGDQDFLKRRQRRRKQLDSHKTKKARRGAGSLSGKRM
jgi:hypothetical protein